MAVRAVQGTAPRHCPLEPTDASCPCAHLESTAQGAARHLQLSTHQVRGVGGGEERHGLRLHRRALWREGREKCPRRKHPSQQRRAHLVFSSSLVALSRTLGQHQPGIARSQSPGYILLASLTRRHAGVLETGPAPGECLSLPTMAAEARPLQRRRYIGNLKAVSYYRFSRYRVGAVEVPSQRDIGGCIVSCGCGSLSRQPPQTPAPSQSRAASVGLCGSA